MDPFNLNELATTVISQAHDIRLLHGEVARLTIENAQLTQRVVELTPQDGDAEPEEGQP